MKQLSNCIDIESGNKVSFSKTEKKKTFVLKLLVESEFECRIIDIDKCVFNTEEIKRSDWLFLVSDRQVVIEPKAYYVELKGTNIDEAAEQLFNAIDRTKGQIHNYDIEARVVSVRGAQPEIHNSGYCRRVRKLIKKDVGFCKVHKGNNFTHIEKI